MPDEESGGSKFEHLATRFDRMAERDDARAAEFRRWATQKSREAEEHPQASEVRTCAESLLGVVAYWEERAAWAREMAGKFRQRGGGARRETRAWHAALTV
jgi:hypothetical protein